ncbi:MAG: hypothetical protein QOI26_1310 [Pseudonocardiales bacterium]|nr:hypothetical protein [Pseudonocardiales bacterium]
MSASRLEKRAAAMMTVTVYLAEEWRKQDAVKIDRAILRLILSGKPTFHGLLNDSHSWIAPISAVSRF